MKTYKLFRVIEYTIMLTSLVSCMNYYKISKSPLNTSTPDTVIQANAHDYFILRNGDSAYHMSNMTVSEDKKSLTCMLDTLPAEHKLHLENGRNGNMRYNKDEPDAVVLDEIHLFIQQDFSVTANVNYTLPFDKIKKIEVLEKDKERTSSSYIGGAIGITLGAILAFFAIVGLSFIANY